MEFSLSKKNQNTLNKLLVKTHKDNVCKITVQLSIKDGRCQTRLGG